MAIDLRVSESSDLFVRNMVAVVATETLTGRTARVALDRRAIVEPDVARLAVDRLRLMVHPWLAPDRVAGWRIEPFPRLARLVELYRRAVSVAQRLHNALPALRQPETALRRSDRTTDANTNVLDSTKR